MYLKFITIIMILCCTSGALNPKSKMLTEKKDDNSKHYEIKLEPRIFGYIPGFHQLELIEIPDATTSTTTLNPVEARLNRCRAFGGQIINTTYCFQYIPNDERSWQDAVEFCSAKGSHLWVPNVYDAELSFILFEQMPQIYAETFTETIWVGISKQGGNYLSVTGQNFNSHPLLAQFLDYDYYLDGECVSLVLSGNTFDLIPVDCFDTVKNFVCEYAV